MVASRLHRDHEFGYRALWRRTYTVSNGRGALRSFILDGTDYA